MFLGLVVFFMVVSSVCTCAIRGASDYVIEVKDLRLRSNWIRILFQGLTIYGYGNTDTLFFHRDRLLETFRVSAISEVSIVYFIFSKD